jgi:hypothetical protein
MGKHNIRDKHVKGKQHCKQGKLKTRVTITQGKKIKGEK